MRSLAFTPPELLYAFPLFRVVGKCPPQDNAGQNISRNIFVADFMSFLNVIREPDTEWLLNPNNRQGKQPNTQNIILCLKKKGPHVLFTAPISAQANTSSITRLHVVALWYFDVAGSLIGIRAGRFAHHRFPAAVRRVIFLLSF